VKYRVKWAHITGLAWHNFSPPRVFDDLQEAQDFILEEQKNDNGLYRYRIFEEPTDDTVDLKPRVMKQIANELKGYPGIKRDVMKALKKCETPKEFEGFLFNLGQRLMSLFYSDQYRRNWHSIHCECDECLALDQEDHES